MSQSGHRFFGLTSLKKQDLYINECIEIAYAYSSMSYWDAYILPVAIRKYMITRYNEIIEEQQQQANKQSPSNIDQKLTKFEEAIKDKHESLNSHDKDRDMSSFMKPVR